MSIVNNAPSTITSSAASSTAVRTNALPHVLVGAAIMLIIVTGLIHFVEAPDNLVEAAYKGGMFILNGIAAFVAAVGIYRGSKTWGWSLGLLVAGGAIVMYIVSRTIGLPGLGVDDAWFEPMGVLSVLVEGAFVVIAALTLWRYQVSGGLAE